MSFFLSSLKQSGHLDKIHMTICIVGSRKIVNEDDYASKGWHLFAPNLTILGFDADKEACNLANAEIEARQVNWAESHIPLALWNSIGKQTLYVTRYPGCSSLYQPNESYMQRFNGYIDLIQLDRTIEVETTTLDTFCQSEKIKEIDFIHLDVQGGELSVLEGASEILDKSILAVYSEVEFTDIYVNQPLFGDLDIYLRNQDFTLFDLIVSTGRAVRTTSPIVSPNRPGSLVWADALYLRDLIRPNLNTHLQTPERILKLACIADVMDYTDYALELLEYLTLNYGNDSNYNFADNIIESLAQVPELVKQGIENLPIVNRLRDYASSNNIYLRDAKTKIKGNKNRISRAANLTNKSERDAPTKPSVCKFLKFRDEIYKCTDYLHRNGYASHNLVCKDWDIAHIIFDLSDGNLLDMGSSDSYILKNAVLKNVQGEKYGIDLQPPDVPLEEVKYMIGDLMDTKLPDSYFTNITCLSVIEHEVDFQKFATEVSRLLSENGKLYVTFDYWTPKLKPDFKLYDKLWNPLDENDTKNLIGECKNCGLNLVEPVDWSLGDAVIKPGYFSPGANISYTFGMLVFQKN
ncbi:FkbM family methyltransferase [Microcoleus sp. S11D4]|uniref:FkbM family methyltransferase n=1 Tax=Microcoleus sp. S11D4 TaxID=3055407 RepID=UPI002FD3CC3A